MALRVAVLAGLLIGGIATSASAQAPMGQSLPTFETAPPAPPPGAGMGGTRGAPPPGAPPMGAAPAGAGGFGPPRAQDPPCFKEFVPLRDAAEQKGLLIKAAVERKADRQEVCKLFKVYAAAESKVMKFITENKEQCQVPQQAVNQMQANHDRTVKTRDQVCAGGPGAAGGPAPPPPQPRLSDELGVRNVISPEMTKPGRGTFDTLTGNPLAR
jgi:hypothetical protein